MQKKLLVSRNERGCVTKQCASTIMTIVLNCAICKETSSNIGVVITNCRRGERCRAHRTAILIGTI